MNERVYPNTGAYVPPVNDFSTPNPQPLRLFAEDRITITDTFLSHLAHCHFTPRRFRIVLAVFKQTVGFNKLEDDMNGVRLQQLTGILANHANSTVRDLEQLNVLVTRKGEYGHYLAINFDFSQWGQTDNGEKPVIDPSFLLPDIEENDTGIDLSSSLANESSNKTNIDADAINVSIDLPMSKSSSVSGEKPVNDSIEPVIIHNEIINQCLDAIKTLSQKVEQLENQYNAPVTPETQVSIINKRETTSLRYPTVLTAQQCQEAKIIIKQVNEPDKAQLLLDMLAKRMNNQHDPLRNPMRYLNTLVTKFNRNQLSITTENKHTQPATSSFVSTTTSVTGGITPVPSEAELIQAEYQEATLDCMQMQRNITMMAEKDNLTFEESLIKLDLKLWWEQIKERFYAAKAALALLPNADTNVDALAP